MASSTAPGCAAPFYIKADDARSKQELLKAALRRFVRDGLCESTIRDIAADAGYTNPVLFKFFKGKEALALYLFEHCYRHFARELRKVALAKRPYPEVLTAVIRRSCALIDENPDAFLYLQDNLRRFWPQMQPAVRQLSLIALMRKLLRSGVEEGAVTTEVEIDILVAAVVGLLSQFARLSYFQEIRGRVTDWIPSIENSILRLTRP